MHNHCMVHQSHVWRSLILKRSRYESGCDSSTAAPFHANKHVPYHQGVPPETCFCVLLWVERVHELDRGWRICSGIHQRSPGWCNCDGRVVAWQMTFCKRCCNWEVVGSADSAVNQTEAVLMQARSAASKARTRSSMSSTT